MTQLIFSGLVLDDFEVSFANTISTISCLFGDKKYYLVVGSLDDILFQSKQIPDDILFQSELIPSDDILFQS